MENASSRHNPDLRLPVGWQVGKVQSVVTKRIPKGRLKIFQTTPFVYIVD
ncbi:hypothetical protein NEISICOT_00076 [Neisseria sicca ATCC 29256]|uniref:Uncharacterized protein n=1 Tax=Neisseria sicca ATCC 29256 TaxID=547045 RepID=C6M0Q1_NEISI|nr:hypothetical protein NEISICOT_00076 [Neisseria sicca ATCC 29256]